MGIDVEVPAEQPPPEGNIKEHSAMPTSTSSDNQYRYEYYLFGIKPVCVAYDDKDRARTAEYPDVKTGSLLIDNMLLSPIELTGEAYDIDETEWNARCEEIFKENIIFRV